MVMSRCLDFLRLFAALPLIGHTHSTHGRNERQAEQNTPIGSSEKTLYEGWKWFTFLPAGIGKKKKRITGRHEYQIARHSLHPLTYAGLGRVASCLDPGAVREHEENVSVLLPGEVSVCSSMSPLIHMVGGRQH